MTGSVLEEGQLRRLEIFFESHRRITHLESSSYSVIKWPFYDPPLAYLIRTDYTITAVNSIPSCGLLVASKFWRVVKKRKEKKEKKVQRNRQRVGKGKGRRVDLIVFSKERCETFVPWKVSSMFRVCWKPDYRGTV